VVIASYYVLFAVVGGSLRALAAESMVDDRVRARAVAGLRVNL
jgi:hypothetical protein